MRCFGLIVLLCHIVVGQNLSLSDSDGLDPVLLITARGSIFDLARNGLVNELRDDFSLSTIEVGETTTTKEIEKIINSFNIPKAVVLIGNNAIRLYKKYEEKNKYVTSSIQVISLLALDVERAVAGIPNVNAISYKTPIVTALTYFRRVTGLPVKNVGVVYREPFSEFINKQTVYCEKENFSLKKIKISSKQSSHKKEIANALRTLVKEDGVDILWIANDDILLKPDLLGNVWLPGVRKMKIPAIVGVEGLVNPELNFGTFAVIPDPVALGEQAAEIVFDLQLDNWESRESTIHNAFSVYSVLNLKNAKRFVKKNDLKTYEVSKVLK